MSAPRYWHLQISRISKEISGLPSWFQKIEFQWLLTGSLSPYNASLTSFLETWCNYLCSHNYKFLPFWQCCQILTTYWNVIWSFPLCVSFGMNEGKASIGRNFGAKNFLQRRSFLRLSFQIYLHFSQGRLW